MENINIDFEQALGFWLVHEQCLGNHQNLYNHSWDDYMLKNSWIDTLFDSYAHRYDWLYRGMRFLEKPYCGLTERLNNFKAELDSGELYLGNYYFCSHDFDVANQYSFYSLEELSMALDVKHKLDSRKYLCEFLNGGCMVSIILAFKNTYALNLNCVRSELFGNYKAEFLLPYGTYKCKLMDYAVENVCGLYERKIYIYGVTNDLEHYPH